MVPPPPLPELEEEIFLSTRVIGTEMFYYGEINDDEILDFIEKFKKLEIELLKRAAELPGYVPTIRVNIKSEGGDLFAGLSVMNILEKSKVKVITIAQGACCSAATFMLLGGSDRRMAKNSYMLIHQLSSGGFWGKFEDLKDEMKACEKFMTMIRETYKSKTKLSDRKLGKLMKRDVYMSPAECIKYKIIDGID